MAETFLTAGLPDQEVIDRFNELRNQWLSATRNISVGSGDVTATKQLSSIFQPMKMFYLALVFRFPETYTMEAFLEYEALYPNRVRVAFSTY